MLPLAEKNKIGQKRHKKSPWFVSTSFLIVFFGVTIRLPRWKKSSSFFTRVVLKPQWDKRFVESEQTRPWWHFRLFTYYIRSLPLRCSPHGKCDGLSDQCHICQQVIAFAFMSPCRSGYLPCFQESFSKIPVLEISDTPDTECSASMFVMFFSRHCAISL